MLKTGMRDLRSMTPPRGALVGPARGKWQREWPAVAPGAAIVRWRVMAYSCGAWYEGFVFRYCRLAAAGSRPARERFQVFYLEDEDEEWFDWPEGSLVFSDARPESARVSAAKVTEACRMHGA